MRQCVAFGLPVLLGSMCLAPAAAQSLGPSGAQLLHRSGETIQLQSGGTTTLGFSFFAPNGVTDGGSALAQYVDASFSGLSLLDPGPDSISNTALLAEGYVGPQGGLPVGAGPLGVLTRARLSVDGTQLVTQAILPDRTALFAGPIGNLSLVAETKGGTAVGTTAPGTQGAVFAGLYVMYFQAITPQGQTLFRGQLTGGNVTSSANDEAYFLHTPAGLELIAREGDPSPLGPVFKSFDSAAAARMDVAGRVAFRARMEAFTGPANLQLTEDEAWFLRGPGGAPSVLIREGDASPYPGYSIGVGNGFWNEAIGTSCFNSNGELLLSSPLNGAVLADQSRALIVASQNGSRGVARVGDPLAGFPGAALSVFSNAALALNDVGQVLFVARIGGLPTGLDSGLFLAHPTGMVQLLVLEGTLAPGSQGGRFEDLFANTQSVALNNSGVVLFPATVVGGNFPGRALYRYEAGLGLQPVALSGETFPGVPVTFAPSSDFSFDPAGTGSGRSWALNDNGTAVVRAAFGFFESSALFRLPAGTQFVSPAALSTSSGGVAEIRTHLGSSQAGRTYLTLASLSGSSPGLPLGPVNLPLNPDALTDAGLAAVNTPPWATTLGVLDDAGQATASLTVPAGLTGLTGLGVTFATLAIETSGIPSVAAASTPARLDLVP